MPVEAAPLIGFAQFLGRHALAAFLAGLLVAVLAAGVAVVLRWCDARRDPVEVDSTPTSARLFASLATGFALILGTASLFAAIAYRLGPGRTMGLADQALADAIAQHTPAAALRAFACSRTSAIRWCWWCSVPWWRCGCGARGSACSR